MHAVFSAYIKTPLLIMLGGFSSGYYWSSTENDNNNAWKQNFNNGNQNFIIIFLRKEKSM
jgi:hypothetical protein